MKKKGFTLIELLIVVAIIGILAAIAVPNFINARLRAQVAKIQADARALGTAMEQYKLDNNFYPVDGTNRNPIGLYQLTTPVAYMSSIPRDPLLNVNWQEVSGEAIGPFMELGTDTPRDGNTDQRILGTWSLTSAGPDQDDDTAGQTGWPNGTRWFDFEPSNGLISNGDLFFMGGNFAAGNFTRNGKPNR